MLLPDLSMRYARDSHYLKPLMFGVISSASFNRGVSIELSRAPYISHVIAHEKYIKPLVQQSLVLIHIIPLTLAPVWAYSVGALAQSPKGRTPNLNTRSQSMINNKLHAIMPNMNRAVMARTFRRVPSKRRYMTGGQTGKLSPWAIQIFITVPIHFSNPDSIIHIPTLL